ncbi:MAG: cation/multidrug efflux pump [Gammaproteobacteria bacterium]|nr:cation/multidrug efflux pump [Gammaproteobacteria bacterium]MDH5344264.1 cation/multidrug efflux pump [Gammaproteobacteria bacterium]
MGWLIAIVLVAAFLAFRFLFHALVCVRRRHMLRAGSSCVGGLVAATFAGAGAVLLISYVGYGRLVEEQPVSELQFRRVSAEEYQARLMMPGLADRFFILRGDEWQMDARILTWKPPLTMLGLDPVYKLDRLSGRYAEIDREQNEARTVHSLAPSLPADVWRLARRFPAWVPGVDAHYGTATYLPMADGARYAVSLSRDALIARPVNEQARQAVGEWSVPAE